MVTACQLQFLLLCGLPVVGSAHDRNQHCSGRAPNGNIDDEVTLLQTRAESVKRDRTSEANDAAGNSARLSAGKVVVVEWNLGMDNTKGPKYMFFKNIWWPWFANEHKDDTVLLHIAGTNLRDQASQISNGQIGGTFGDLLGGAVSGTEDTPPPVGITNMEEIHRCVSPGTTGDLVFLTNAKAKYDSSGSSCSKMYDHFNITNAPHSIKFGGYTLFMVDGGKTTELAARLFRAAITHVKAGGHDKDIVMGSFNVDPTDNALHDIYQGIPDKFDLKAGTKATSGSSNVVFAVGPDKSPMSPTCFNCHGKPSAEIITDYAVTGPSAQLDAVPAFEDAAMFQIWKDLGAGKKLPTSIPTNNMFPAQKLQLDGVHVPLVYSVPG